MKTLRSHVRCYDRFATQKRIAAAALLTVAGIGASFAFTGSAEAAEIKQLPRVVVTGKAQKIAQLPRVVVEGRRVSEATRFADASGIRRVSLESTQALKKQTEAGI